MGADVIPETAPRKASACCIDAYAPSSLPLLPGKTETTYVPINRPRPAGDDVQYNDFSARGALAVQDGDLIVPGITRADARG